MPAVSTPAGASRTLRPPIDPVGRDLGERQQHEGALEQARVRQRQAQFVDREVVIGEDVDVDGARAPALLVRAVAAERAARPLARAPAGRAGASVVSTAMHRLTKGGWSLKPQGGVR